MSVGRNFSFYQPFSYLGDRRNMYETKVFQWPGEGREAVFLWGSDATEIFGNFCWDHSNTIYGQDRKPWQTRIDSQLNSANISSFLSKLDFDVSI